MTFSQRRNAVVFSNLKMFLKNILSQFLIVKDNFVSFKTALCKYVSMQTSHAYYCLSQVDVSLIGQRLGVLSRHVHVGWFQEFKFNQLIHSILINKSWIYLIVFGFCWQIHFWKLTSLFSGCAGFQITKAFKHNTIGILCFISVPICIYKSGIASELHDNYTFTIIFIRYYPSNVDPVSQ